MAVNTEKDNSDNQKSEQQDKEGSGKTDDSECGSNTESEQPKCDQQTPPAGESTEPPKDPQGPTQNNSEDDDGIILDGGEQGKVAMGFIAKENSEYLWDHNNDGGSTHLGMHQDPQFQNGYF